MARNAARGLDPRQERPDLAWPLPIPCSQMSPAALEVTFGSNSWPCAVAATLTVPAGAPPSPNGPLWPMSAAQTPGDTWAALTLTVAPLPCAAA